MIPPPTSMGIARVTQAWMVACYQPPADVTLPTISNFQVTPNPPISGETRTYSVDVEDDISGLTDLVSCKVIHTFSQDMTLDSPPCVSPTTCSASQDGIFTGTSQDIRFECTDNDGNKAVFPAGADVDPSLRITVDFESIDVTPDPMNFGGVTEGTTLDKTFTIENNGGTDPLVGSMTLTGDSEFTIVGGSCNYSLGVGAFKACDVRFSPPPGSAPTTFNADANFTGGQAPTVPIEGDSLAAGAYNVTVTPNPDPPTGTEPLSVHFTFNVSNGAPNYDYIIDCDNGAPIFTDTDASSNPTYAAATTGCIYNAAGSPYAMSWSVTDFFGNNDNGTIRKLYFT